MCSSDLEELIKQCRDAGFSAELAQPLERAIRGMADLRQVYPPEFEYMLNFSERVILRELLAPDEHDSHWWRTGMYILREGLANHARLVEKYRNDFDDLEVQLIKRLDPSDDINLREINAKTVSGICLLSEIMAYPQN